MILKTLLALAMLGAAAVASAQPAGGPPDTPEMRAVIKACAVDVKTLCADAPAGGIGRCMLANSAKASPECQAAMAKLPPPPQDPAAKPQR